MSTTDYRQELQKYIHILWQPPLVYIAARLGLADLLLDEPKHSEELAHQLGANAPALYRVMRAMVAIGLLTEADDGRFALTPMGELLQSNGADSLRDEAIVAGEVWPAWQGLLHSIRTGQTSFEHVYGADLFSYVARDATLRQHFYRNIARGTRKIARAAVAAYEFSGFRRIVDVGGGYGTLLKAILSANSAARGVLFDLPHVLEDARPQIESAECANRCELIPGDFFESVPAGGDAYLLQFTIHDWDDESAVKILMNCRRAIAEHGKLLVIERLMPECVEQAPDTIYLDLSMLVFTGGHERTEDEYRSLFAAAGFQLARVIPTAGDWSVIEGVPIPGAF